MDVATRIQDRDVTLDLTEVAFIDAYGIGRLVDASVLLARRGHRLRVVNASSTVAQTLRIADVGWLLDADPNADSPRGSSST